IVPVSGGLTAPGEPAWKPRGTGYCRSALCPSRALLPHCGPTLQTAADGPRGVSPEARLQQHAGAIRGRPGAPRERRRRRVDPGLAWTAPRAPLLRAAAPRDPDAFRLQARA